MEAKRVLARRWRRAEAEWDKAEAADVAVARSKRQGINAQGVSLTARAAWVRATAAFEQVERLEAAWDRAHAALDLFRADGRLNDPAHAELEIALALKGLADPDGSKTRNFLNDPRSLAFLDRMHRRLEAAEPRRAWRVARGDGLAVAAASSPAEAVGPGDHPGASRRPRPRTERGGTRLVRPRRGGAPGHVPSQQRRRVHEQRAPHAAVAA